MSIETSEPDQIIREAIKQRVATLNTGCPAYVVDITDGQYVDVQPVIRGKMLNDDEETESFLPPQILNVPLVIMQGGAIAQTFPIKTSKTHGVDNATWVWLTFGDRSMDEWVQYGEKDVTPASGRRHNASDAVAYAGIRPKPVKLDSIPDDRVRLGQTGSSSPTRIEVTETGGGGASTGYVRIGNDTAELLTIVDDLLAAIEDGGILDPVSGYLPFIADITGVPTAMKPIIVAIRLLLDQIREP